VGLSAGLHRYSLSAWSGVGSSRSVIQEACVIGGLLPKTKPTTGFTPGKENTEQSSFVLKIFVSPTILDILAQESYAFYL